MNKLEPARELRDQLNNALADAVHIRLMRMAGIRTGVDVLITEARLKDIARRCWEARACLDRPIVMCAGAVARGERVRRK
ncbi:hypothetical protein WS58_16665 [Burkholderia pseudomultivorans]|uniref:hypothetical protein n=1 Tax=Burkholderia pseudomultivorans TaxID=1207504 RepID=UPI000751B69B|nr:hypothetical protein [Burkholderia pseudomultivorans]KVC27794.1 hypothetical protein WS55_13035 [Burkholderia pseudomultivorans]KVC36916.1 hypothetical protein WS56_00405 [Burkholderia pseudomultivorans]KVC42157.1 hypothetical protein WS58_16665 [Burkholderia pseudomultivorans]